MFFTNDCFSSLLYELWYYSMIILLLDFLKNRKGSEFSTVLQKMIAI